MKQRSIQPLLSKMERFLISIKPGDFSEIEDDTERAEAMRQAYAKRAEHKTDFDFACMQSREGDSAEAELWLEVAFENADDVDAMRLKALDHADLEAVWGQIGWV